MKYSRFDELPGLLEQRLITRRPHPRLPIDIYNYSASAQFLPIREWTEALKDCRGLILDRDGEIVGRPFRKFWNYDQVMDQIPSAEPFTVWEKVDGSLGIVCYYVGERVASTRGSFESDQAVWLTNWLNRKHPDFYPSGETWLLEIVYPENRIVVDYGDTKDAFLLAVLDAEANAIPALFDSCTRFRKARRFDGLAEFSHIDSDPQFAGQEGFVVRWESGFLAKVKLTEYKRLHRLITQVSTRTIWEMLRTGASTAELMDRVPQDFAGWVSDQINGMNAAYDGEIRAASALMEALPPQCSTRKDFAEYAKKQAHPSLLFSLLDGKDISGAVWKIIEPKWSTPFRREAE
jgi:RNA ligase